MILKDNKKLCSKSGVLKNNRNKWIPVFTGMTNGKKGRRKASKEKGRMGKDGGLILLVNLISLAEIIKTCNKKGGVK